PSPLHDCVPRVLYSSAKRISTNLEWVRAGSILITALRAIRITLNTTRAAHPRALQPLWPQALSRSHWEPTAAAPCACRPTCAASHRSSPHSVVSRPTAYVWPSGPWDTVDSSERQSATCTLRSPSQRVSAQALHSLHLALCLAKGPCASACAKAGGVVQR